MFTRTLTALVLVMLSASAAAQKLDINLSQDSARFSYISLVGGSTYGRTELNFGLLYNEDDNSAVDIGLHVIDVAGSKTPGLEVGVGPRFYYVKLDKPDADGAVIALGVNLRYKLPSIQRLALHGSAYYAPSITSTMNAENFYELGFRIAYELLPTADAYLGYRRLRAKFDQGVGSQTIDSGAVFGVRFAF